MTQILSFTTPNRSASDPLAMPRMMFHTQLSGGLNGTWSESEASFKPWEAGGYFKQL